MKARKLASHVDPVTAYARSVVAGSTIAGLPVRQACQRHLRDVETGSDRGLVWMRERAEHALSFFPDFLRLDDEKPFVLMPWQQFIIGSITGWYMSDGTRRFRHSYVCAAKGAGKSPLAAGLGLYGMIADGEPAAEVYAAAVTREQASVVFRDAKRMVESSPDLRRIVKVEVGCLSLGHSVFRPVSSEHRGLDGKRVHIGIIDELHEHPNAQVTDKIRAGTKGQKNAHIFEITNAGYDRHSVCWDHHEYSLKVLSGILENDAWFAYVCALDDGDLWTDETVWPKANPGIGITLPLRYLREQVAEAQGMPSKENLVRRLNFCEWTQQESRWISMPVWDEGADPIDIEGLRGRTCYGGLDLARVRDLSAFALLFPPDEDERWTVLCWFWIPGEDVRIRSHRDRVPYDVWVRDGLITQTEGNTTDYGVIARDILDISSLYQIRQIAFDRTFSGEIVQRLMSEGLAMVEFGQGFLSLAAPTAELERMILGRQLHHGGNPVLRWNASNVAVLTDAAGNQKPDKEHSRERIDGVAALVNATGMAIRSAGAPVDTWDGKIMVLS